MINKIESFKLDDFISINIAVTYRCMLKCRMCNMWGLQKYKNNLEELSIDEWKNFIKGLRKSTNKAFLINFAGGEPLMKGEILELVNFCAEQKFNTYIGTNAFLIDMDLAKKIIDSGLSAIGLSLESLDENVHDSLRGVNGAYCRVMEAIDNLGRFSSNLRIIISTIIMEQNLDSIIPLVKWVESNDRLGGVTFQAIMQPFSTPFDMDWYKKQQYSFLWPKEFNKAHDVISELIEMKRERKSKILNSVSQLYSFNAYFKNPQELNNSEKCKLAGKAMDIEARGTLKLCFDMKPIGNVKDTSLEEMLNSCYAMQIAKIMKNCTKKCHYLINCFYDT